MTSFHSVKLCTCTEQLRKELTVPQVLSHFFLCDSRAQCTEHSVQSIECVENLDRGLRQREIYVHRVLCSVQNVMADF